MIAPSLTSIAAADVVSVAAAGFEVRETAHVAVPPARAFDQFAAQVSRWWSSEHTWSGSSKNLSIRMSAGGCFCERLPNGGSVEHLRVVFVRPGSELSMSGGLGPLQSMGFFGVMRVAFAAQRDGTDVTLTYRVHGYDPKGAEHLAPMVDGMLSETLKRFQRFADTGDPQIKR
jgi:uncharacterized protein YndB with AHSA1/START domain